MKRRQVLFLCTGNSCRSQMAEAIVNHQMQDTWIAYSAGTHPAGYVHPVALQVLAELGIEHHGQSKGVDRFQDLPFDLIITVCDSASEECPVWPGSGQRLHIGFPDPAEVSGSEAEILTAFRNVRDDIIQEIPRVLAQITYQ